MPANSHDVYPLLWSNDVAKILSWAVASLGMQESWRAPGANGEVEHAELTWPGGKVSISVRTDKYTQMGPSGIALRVQDNAEVERIHTLATNAKAKILQPLMDSPVAYSFTALDPDGNQWWVHAETGMLDELRQG